MVNVRDDTTPLIEIHEDDIHSSETQAHQCGDTSPSEVCVRKPLHIAAERGDLGVVEVLLSHGASADIDATTYAGCTALHLAAGLGHCDIVRALTSAGATLDTKGEHDLTPLLAAAQHGHSKVVLTLLKAGADVNLSAEGDVTALHLASAEGHDHTVIALCGEKHPHSLE